MENQKVKVQSLRIQIPSSSPPFIQAAKILSGELVQRVDVDCKIVEQEIPCEPSHDLCIQIETLKTVPETLMNQFDPPLTLHPYPDYAEHINIRTMTKEKGIHIVVVCGSEKSLLFGIGFVLRSFFFYSDSLEYAPLTANYQPLIPMRGFFFDHPSSLNKEEKLDFFATHALWGNNIIGWNRQDLHSTPSASSCVDILFMDKTIPDEPGEESQVIWLNPSKQYRNQPLGDWFAEIIETVHSIRKKYAHPELWLGIEPFNEEQLSELFFLLEQEQEHLFKVLVSGPQNDWIEFIRREMPLSMQLLTMTPLHSPKTDPFQIAQKFFDHAPLTYGALGYSINGKYELYRFIWSMLSWSPQPSVEESVAMYGNMYFGMESSDLLKQSIFSGGKTKEDFLRWLETIKRSLPSKMLSMAKPRLDQLKNLPLDIT